MKIYTQTYDLAKASPHRFWVAPFSEFKIGIKILEKDEISAKDFTLKAGSVEFTPDEDKIDNFTLFTIKSNDTGFVEYTIEVEGVAEKLKLMQIVTDSTVFEIDASGGDVPADVATQTWVNSQISDFVTEDYVDSAISDFITEIPANLSAETFAVKNASYTVISAGTGTENDSGVLNVNGTAASLRVGTPQTTGSVRINSNGTTPSIEGGKGTGPEAAYSLSCDTTGHGILTLNTTSLNEAELTAIKALPSNVYTKSETSSAVELADAFAGAGISIREALDNGICLPQTIFENVDGTFGSLDLSGEVDFTEGRIGTGASILSNAVRVNIGTNISAFGGRAFGWTNNLTSLVIPESVTRFNTYEMFSSSKLDSISATVRIPDSVTVFGTGSILWNSRYLTIDFGDTRKTIPSASNLGSLATGDTVYVPDSLYSTWIATSGWQNPSNTKIFPRSVMTAAQKVGKEKTGQAPIVNTIHSVYETDWATLSATADANTFYVVVSDPE